MEWSRLRARLNYIVCARSSYAQLGRNPPQIHSSFTNSYTLVSWKSLLLSSCQRHYTLPTQLLRLGNNKRRPYLRCLEACLGYCGIALTKKCAVLPTDQSGALSLYFSSTESADENVDHRGPMLVQNVLDR